jgi:hypothetical protein
MRKKDATAPTMSIANGTRTKMANWEVLAAPWQLMHCLTSLSK